MGYGDCMEQDPELIYLAGMVVKDESVMKEVT